MQPHWKKIAEIIEEAKLLIELPLGVAFQTGSISFREMHCRHFGMLSTAGWIHCDSILTSAQP